MSTYSYEQWLASHARRKTMMEKLERSLIHYELFALMPMRNDKSPKSGSIQYSDNSYSYQITYDYESMGHHVYNVYIEAERIKDRWHELLNGYRKFKLVMKGDDVLTIYADREKYFQQIIDMFECEDTSNLYRNRSSYVNNLLARYILLRLIEAHRPNMQLLASVAGRDGKLVSVMAANANRTKMVMYDFSKAEAINLARHYDGISRKLTVVYFFNQDFETLGNTVNYATDTTQVVSIRRFFRALPLNELEMRRIERKVLLLVSMLYNENISWNTEYIRVVATNPPYFHVNPKSQRRRGVLCRNSLTGAFACNTPIYRTLLEDALNVLEDEPRTQADIFHFLCASTLVNAYINRCNHRQGYDALHLRRMFKAKQQIFSRLRDLSTTGSKYVKIALSTEPAVLAEINTGGFDYQFSFRGLSRANVEEFVDCGTPRNGRYRGFANQSIAPVLFQYSHILRGGEVLKTTKS